MSLDKNIENLERRFEATGDISFGYQLALLYLRANQSHSFYRTLIQIYLNDPGNESGISIAVLLMQKLSLKDIEKTVSEPNESNKYLACAYAIFYVYHILFELPIDQISMTDHYPGYELMPRLNDHVYINVYTGRWPQACYRFERRFPTYFSQDFKNAREVLSKFYGLEEEYPDFEKIWDPAAQSFIDYPTPERVIILSSSPSFDFEKGRPLQAWRGKWRRPEGLVSFQVVESYDINDVPPPDEDDEGYYEWYENQVVPHYLNTYMVEQSYGGPEEGGWWFNSGEPLATAVIGEWRRGDLMDLQNRRQNEFMEDLEKEFPFMALINLSYDLYGAEQTAQWQAMFGSGLAIQTQEHPAKFFPQQRPHYE